MGRLTTHVLDTSAGIPAADLRIELVRPDSGETLADVRTDADGRVAAPLLSGEAFVPGGYELRFHVGDYFRGRGVAPADPPFLDVVPVRFAVAEPEGHYHVPLLIAPYGYSTYRGS